MKVWTPGDEGRRGMKKFCGEILVVTAKGWFKCVCVCICVCAYVCVCVYVSLINMMKSVRT